MSVDVVVEDARWAAVDIDALAQQASDAVFDRLGLEPSVFEIALLACDDDRIAALNADFRGKTVPTNVLSWPSDERAPAVAGEMPLAPDPDHAAPAQVTAALSYPVAEPAISPPPPRALAPRAPPNWHRPTPR